ncbi:hypothetical protein V6N12_039365 [Hibiscus sabdariffa]|uniref:Uncharacterized protein n=1 Tax=Hibiscus sabdariffa TaxID=183260 RepID=A0ABR2E0H4_9ROSI
MIPTKENDVVVGIQENGGFEDGKSKNHEQRDMGKEKGKGKGNVGRMRGLEFESWECSTLGARGTKPSGSCHTSSGISLPVGN